MHYHLLVEARDKPLSDFMERLQFRNNEAQYWGY